MKKIILFITLLIAIPSLAQNVTVVFFDSNNPIQGELNQEVSKLYGKKNINVLWMNLPKSAYTSARKRYRADTLLGFLNRLNKGVILGITSKDISCTNGNIKDWGVFGLGSSYLKSAVISSYRLKTKEDLISTALHELGHIYGLPHCPNEKCVMADAKGKYTKATYWMCDNCKKKLNELKEKNISFRLSKKLPLQRESLFRYRYT